MKEAVIVSAVRTPVGKAPKGMFKTTQPEHLSVTTIRAALDRAPGLDPAEIDDVIMGCAFPEAEQGLNCGRNYALLAGLPVTVPGVTLTRFCASGLQSIVVAAQAIMCGQAEVLLAGGIESMSRVPGRRQQADEQLGHAEGQCGSVRRHGHHGRERRLALQRHPRGTGHLCRREPAPGSGRHRERHLRRRDRAGGGQAQAGRPGRHGGREDLHGHHRRGATCRQHLRGARQAEAGLQEGRHGHRGQLLADERRRGHDGSHERREGLRVGAGAARPVRGVRSRRLRTGRDGHRTGVRHPQGAQAGRA